jgi:hypothetical protein
MADDIRTPLRFLRTAGHGLLVVISVVSLGVTLHTLFSVVTTSHPSSGQPATSTASGSLPTASGSSGGQTPPAPRPSLLQVGDTVSTVDTKVFAQSPRTLLLAYSKDCGFCAQSKPFYQRLGQLARQAGDWQLVVVSSDNYHDLSHHLQREQIGAAYVVTLTKDPLLIPGTPTLMLCDASGKIGSIWVGRLDTAGENDVLASLTREHSTD